MAAAPPLFLRRLRAALRKLVPGGAGGVEGFVDGCVAGEIRGWAMDPRQPNRRVHVIALCDGRVVAEALADQMRADLVQDGRGDGRHAFRLRLPGALLDGERRRVQVQAMQGGKAVRLLRGEVDIEPPAPAASGGQAVRTPGPGATTAIVEAAPPPLMLALWPADGAEAGPLADWGSLARSGGGLVRLGQPGARIARLADAHTVLFARQTGWIDPVASDLLRRSQPLADVLTWDGSTAAARRAEARAIGVLLGETLGGAFALRGHVFRLMGQDFAQALARGDMRRAELLLAARPELRWRHLPGRLTVGAAKEDAPFEEASTEGLGGFRWAEPRGARPARLVPDASPGLITLALWPKWNAAAEASLESLLAQLPPDAAAEVLAPADGVEQTRAFVEASGCAGAERVTVRPVDPPAAGAPAAWLAALGAAASGEVVVVCQAGVRLAAEPGALGEILAWASSPRVGAVTAPIVRKRRVPLAGLALERSDTGWTARSAHSAALEGRRRPVLAAPAGFLAIGRDKLAMLEETAAERLLAGGAELDIGLRLRRLGLPSVLLGDLMAEARDGLSPAGEISGAALAAFDADELAAAAAAYPAQRD